MSGLQVIGLSKKAMEKMISDLITVLPVSISQITDLQGVLDSKLDAGVTPEEIGAATAAVLSTAGLGVVVHGSNPNIARPLEFSQVLWVGTVIPNNGIGSDLLVNKAGI